MVALSKKGLVLVSDIRRGKEDTGNNVLFQNGSHWHVMISLENIMKP